MFDPSIPVVFLAGIISFFAPCFLPLLPVYISTLTGLSIQQLQQKHSKSNESKILVGSLFFVLGFSFVFVCLGLSASWVGRFFISNKTMFSQVSGFILIFFGLSMLGIFRQSGLVNRQLKLTLPNRLSEIHFLGPILMGIAFGFAWTPCIGPILGSVLTLAANTASLREGMRLLFVYSLGISLPFIFVALFLERALKGVKHLIALISFITIIAGLFTLALGVLLVLGQYNTVVGGLVSRFYPPILYNFVLGSV